MRDDLVAIVENETNRNVVAFMSANHIDPDMAAEVFVLEAGPGSADRSRDGRTDTPVAPEG